MKAIHALQSALRLAAPVALTLLMGAPSVSADGNAKKPVKATARPRTPATQGKIIKIDGTRAWINLGASSGIKVGDNFKIFHPGEALIDPDTGAKLGAEEKLTGSGFVVEVQDKYAILQFTGNAVAKDVIRKP